MAENHSKDGLHIVENQPQVAVVVVPFPVQGHLNPLLHLCRRISANNIPVHYFGTATHIRQARDRVHYCWDPSAITNLHFHGFPTPPFENLSPDPNSSCKFPSHLQSILTILSDFQGPLFKLANELSSGNVKRVIVIFDSLMTSVAKSIHILPNVESYCFLPIPAFVLYSFHWEAAGKPDIPTGAGILEELPTMEGCFSPEFQEFMKSQIEARNFHSGTIYNSSRITEGLYLDLLAKARMHGTEKHWGLGPLNPVLGHENLHGSESRSKCLEWLDKQPPNSVIFVSFGTTTSLTDEQIRELANGLERSEQKFIWALKDADKGNIFKGKVRMAELPKGFEERVEERGIVVRDWAPQLEILKHRATGGFLSHCGWNSCIESISMGVPIATWPINTDQPRNSLLITKELKIGVEVRDWASRNELVSSVTIAEVVKRLMASAEGDEMRQRAKKLANSIELSMMEGGAARLEMDSFIAHISR